MVPGMNGTHPTLPLTGLHWYSYRNQSHSTYLNLKKQTNEEWGESKNWNDSMGSAVGNSEAAMSIWRNFRNKSVQIPIGKNHFCINCVSWVRKNKSERHIELKHQTSLGKHLQVNDDHQKSLTKGQTTSKQQKVPPPKPNPQYFVKDCFQMSGQTNLKKMNEWMKFIFGDCELQNCLNC